MPVNKLNLEDERYSFLNLFQQNKDKFIEEYDKSLADKAISEWSMIVLHAGVDYTPNGKKFDVLKECFEKMPKHIQPLSLMFSVIKGKTAFHQEPWTEKTGFHRIHIPLRNVDKCSLFIREQDNQTIEYKYDTKNIYEFVNPYNEHMPITTGDGDRLFILFDYYNKQENPAVSGKDIEEYLYLAETQFMANKGGGVYK